MYAQLFKKLAEENISVSLLDKAAEALREAARDFESIENTVAYNQLKVNDIFIKHRVSDFHFSGSTGYGYGDTGREKLEEIWTEIFAGEDALVRSNIVSGTHAISICLFGILRPGDRFLSVSGKPYDTFLEITGDSADPVPGSLAEFGIRHDWIDLDNEGNFRTGEIIRYVKEKKPKMLCIQRSAGYTVRKSISMDKIAKFVAAVKEECPDVIIFADNCYGEFCEMSEPSSAGCDLTAGSLIKNAGGGIAPRGGYVVGRKDLVELVANCLTAPGLGKEVGASLDFNRYVFQGLFMAPFIVGQALKTASFACRFFPLLGYEVFPEAHEKRGDIVQGIVLKCPEKLRVFCNTIQANSPVDSYVNPKEAVLPGYASPVIMAAGTFVQGSSIELSADAPLREPYAVYLQGGLAFCHSLAAVIRAADKIV